MTRPIFKNQFCQTDVVLGKGYESIVYKGYDIEHDQNIAIKKISNNEKTKPKLLNEIEIMEKMNHKNIIKIYDTIINDNYDFVIILEYCECGTLKDYMKNVKKFSENIVKYYIKQLKDALYFLYINDILHRDLKPDNILLKDNYRTLKLADFGLSKMLNKSELTKTICGTPLYMAPEIIIGDYYNNKCDLWSIGCIIYQMLYEVTPFEKAKSFTELQKLIENTIINYPIDNPITKNCSKLLESLLEKNIEKRINWDNFFYNKWFSNLEDEPEVIFHVIHFQIIDEYHKLIQPNTYRV